MHRIRVALPLYERLVVDAGEGAVIKVALLVGIWHEWWWAV